MNSTSILKIFSFVASKKSNIRWVLTLVPFLKTKFSAKLMLLSIVAIVKFIQCSGARKSVQITRAYDVLKVNLKLSAVVLSNKSYAAASGVI